MRRRRIIIWLLIVLLALLLLPFVFLLFEHVRGRIGLALYRRELSAAGVKITPQELTALHPKGENGAPAVAAGARRLKEGPVWFKNQPPAMMLVPSGRAVAGFQEVEWHSAWDDDGQTNNWSEVAEELETNRTALKEIRVALEKPVLDNQLDYSKGSMMRIPELASCKNIVRWFGAECQLALQDGQNEKAVDALISAMLVVRLPAQDGTQLSELVRIAIAGINRSLTWEVLQADALKDENLSAMQRAWQSQEFANPLVSALDTETATIDASWSALRDSNTNAARLLFLMNDLFSDSEEDFPAWERAARTLPFGEEAARFLKEEVYCRVWRFAWVDQNERQNLKDLRYVRSLAQKAATEKSLEGIRCALDDIAKYPVDRNFYDALRDPLAGLHRSVARVITKAMRAETERSLALCAIAIKRYSLKYQKLPPSLESLVPEFYRQCPSITWMESQYGIASIQRRRSRFIRLVRT